MRKNGADSVEDLNMRVSVMSRLLCYLFGHKYKATLIGTRAEYSFMTICCYEYRCKRCAYVQEVYQTGLEWSYKE